MDLLEILHAQADRANALELRGRHDHHAYLKSRGDDSETLDELIARFASLARLGPPAIEEDLVRLQFICPVPLPAELLAFYRTAGGEAHEFIYLDRHGGFGRLYFHQDAFDELLADELDSMVRQSRPAPDDFGPVVAEFIRHAGQG